MPRNAVGSTLAWAIGLVLVSGVAAATWAMLADGEVQRPRTRAPAPASQAAPLTDAAPLDDPLAEPAPVARPTTRARPPARPVARRRAPLSKTMQAVLAEPSAEKYVLIEVAKIRDSAPGQAILNCLPMRDSADLERLRETAGFDPVRQVERFGFADKVAALEGDFSNVDWAKIDDGFVREERDGVEIYSNGVRRFAVVDRTVMFAGEPEAVDAAIARVRAGETEGAPQVVADASGSIPIQALFHMLPTHHQVRGPLNELLAEHGGNIDMRIDVNDRGADMRFEMDGIDPMIREAVSAGIQAVKNGGVQEGMQEKFAGLIDAIELDPTTDGLKIRAPLTMDFLEAMLGECVHGEGAPGDR